MECSTAQLSINVIIIDDSAIIRGLFTKMLESDPGITVAATASNGIMAETVLRKLIDSGKKINVITLDIRMPDMDGVTVLPRLLKLDPDIKIIMISSLTTDGASETMEALSLGAVDYIQKPDRSDRDAIITFSKNLLEKVNALGKNKQGVIEKASILNNSKKNHNNLQYKMQNVKEVVLKKPPIVWQPEALAIGGSTGAPQALGILFEILSKKTVTIPIFITQHMPAEFTSLLAKQISKSSSMVCEEAIDGELVIPEKIYLAPGDYHMIIEKNKSENRIKLNQNPPENFCRPSVDPMLRSLAKVYGGKVLTVILTGMGADGLDGARKIVDAGGVVVAQDEETSIVWGMPGAVATNGLCTKIEPIYSIVDSLVYLSQGKIA